MKKHIIFEPFVWISSFAQFHSWCDCISPSMQKVCIVGFWVSSEIPDRVPRPREGWQMVEDYRPRSQPGSNEQVTSACSSQWWWGAWFWKEKDVTLHDIETKHGQWGDDQDKIIPLIWMITLMLILRRWNCLQRPQHCDPPQASCPLL